MYNWYLCESKINLDYVKPLRFGDLLVIVANINIEIGNLKHDAVIKNNLKYVELD